MNAPSPPELRHVLYEGGQLLLFSESGAPTPLRWPDGFFVRSEEAERLPRAWRAFVCEPEPGGFSWVDWPEPVRRDGSREGRLRFLWKTVFEPRQVHPLEADVDPVQRFLCERRGVPFARDWRILFLDVETTRVEDWSNPSARSRILSFSWRSMPSGRSGHVRLAALDDAAERALLETFARLAARHDILVAWNGDRFDQPMFEGRCQRLRVAFDSEAHHWLDHLVLFKRYWLRSEDGAVTSSYALGALGEALLGERKIDAEAELRAAGWTGAGDMLAWGWAHAPEVLRRYNDRDVDLMARIEEKTGFLSLHLAICRICRVLPGAASLRPSTLVDGKMLQRGAEQGYRFPTHLPFKDELDADKYRARGAYVPEAKVGLHSSVAVVDYARMYVSIIRAGNMSLETLADNGEIEIPETTETGERTGKVLARFRRAPVGHLPAALGDVITARKRYSDAQKQAVVGSPEFHDLGRLSNACKVLGNTFYGVILSPHSRYHNRLVGESVTSMGRLLLSNTLAEVARRGHAFVFGDTDSVAFGATDEEAEAVKAEVNGAIVPRIVSEIGAISGEIAIDYEKRFRRILVTASKRYAGVYAVYKGKPAAEDAPLDVRGLEIVRSDVCRAARALQREVLERVVRQGQLAPAIATFIDQERARFLAGAGVELDGLVLAKGLTKEPDAYATKPVQAKVAEKLRAEGRDISAGDKVAFVLTLDGPMDPASVDMARVDLFTYWNDHVYPPTSRALEAAFPHVDWKRYSCGRPRPAPVGQVDLFGGARPTQPTAPSPASVDPVRIAVPESVAAPALRNVLAAFAGDRPVVVEVLIGVDGAKSVELACPQRVRSPAQDSRFAQSLRTLGATWAG